MAESPRRDASRQRTLAASRAQKLNGIGKGLGTEIDEWLSTGQMAKMEELRGGGAPKVDPAKIEAVQEKVKATGAHDFL